MGRCEKEKIVVTINVKSMQFAEVGLSKKAGVKHIKLRKNRMSDFNRSLFIKHLLSRACMVMIFICFVR